MDLVSGKTDQGENLTNLDGIVEVRIFALDFNGSRSETLNETVTIPTLNNGPVIVDAVFVNGSNGLRLWSNASDSDNAISTITIAVYRDLTPLGDPVLERTYWINQSTANITDIIVPGALPSGNYLITAYATDMLGKVSAFSGFQRYTLPV